MDTNHLAHPIHLPCCLCHFVICHRKRTTTTSASTKSIGIRCGASRSRPARRCAAIDPHARIYLAFCPDTRTYVCIYIYIYMYALYIYVHICSYNMYLSIYIYIYICLSSMMNLARLLSISRTFNAAHLCATLLYHHWALISSCTSCGRELQASRCRGTACGKIALFQP